MKSLKANRSYGALPWLPAVTAALATAGVISSAQAQIETAGDLFVSVNAITQPDGPLTTIPNNGTLGGVFEARGGGTSIPVIALTGETRGIAFDGGDYMQLVTAAGGTLIPPPDGLVGIDPTRTIEAWAFNPSIAGEETVVSWGRRGGGVGSNMSFNYGSDGRWGAIGHWDAPDIGWNDAGGAPSILHWHHLVYTYDGTTTRVYADGVLSNMEVLGPGVINTHANTSINLATQLEADGVTPTGNLRGSLTIGRVRIHDGVLTDAQVLNNYNTEKAEFVDPTPPEPPVPEPLASDPIHRWSFSEAANPNATDAMFLDTIGTAHGVVRGEGALFNGSRLVLAGGPSGSAAYGDLPNNLLSQNSTNHSGSGEVSIEGWVKVTGGRTWSRLFDIGSSAGGEVNGPGGGGEGLDYLFYSAQTGDDVNTHRLEVRNENPPGGGVATVDVLTATFNNDLHFVITWREASGRITAYENGLEVTSLVVDDAMSDINDVNVWLGRSNWTADQNTQGEYDEFRIYDHVLSRNEVLGNFQAGPDTINQPNVPVTIVAQPEDRIGYDTVPVTFSVRTSGSPPIGYQWSRNAAAIPGATNRNYTFEAALADNGAIFSVVVSNFAGGTSHVVASEEASLTVLQQEVDIRHRYRFSEDFGTTVEDSVGMAPGTLVGGGTFTGGGELVLNGVDSYVNLPNGIISALSNATFEAWITHQSGRNWERIMDFGTSTAGEDGVGNGLAYLFIAARGGPGLRFGAKPANGGEFPTLNGPGLLVTNQEVHVAVTYNVDGGYARLYTNGVLLAGAEVRTPLAAITDNNNWLGRSQFSADPFFAGRYNEFRIHDGAMTPAQVAKSFADGPNAALGVKLRVAPAGPGNITILWPAWASDYFLESSTALGAGAVWQAVTDPQTPVGGFLSVTVPTTGAGTFYRLSR